MREHGDALDMSRIGHVFIGFSPALSPDQKLFPHFGEARTAIFSVKQVEYGAHVQTSLF
jgi:hypothetical protein